MILSDFMLSLTLMISMIIIGGMCIVFLGVKKHKRKKED